MKKEIGIRAALVAVVLLSAVLLAASRTSYKTYEALDGSFSYQLPEDWVTTMESYEGGEILYHMFFQAQGEDLWGFVQVWQLSQPLKDFLEQSAKSPIGVAAFDKYKLKPIEVNGRKGYLLTYTRTNDQGKTYKSFEGFLEDDRGRIYRVSFFAEEKDWKAYDKVIFDKVLGSFEIR